MFTARTIETNGTRLHLESGPPSGPALLCLHGVLRAGRDFAPLLGHLLPRWQVHLLDHRGHGGSAWTPGRYLVADYAADVIALVRDHLEGNVVLLGHSLGALVSIQVAAALPDRITGILLEDPPAQELLRDVRSTSWHTVWAGMAALAHAGSRNTSDMQRRLAELHVPAGKGSARLGDLRDGSSLRFSARCLRELDPEVFVPLLAGRWLDGPDLDGMLARVRCPALLVRGDPALGGMIGRDEAVAMVERMANGTLVDVAGVGHLIHWTATEVMTRLVLGFLESL